MLFEDLADFVLGEGKDFISIDPLHVVGGH